MEEPTAQQAATTRDLGRLLGEHFGFAAFRPGQRELVEAVLSGRDALGILPTGGGKSLAFQLPALIPRRARWSVVSEANLPHVLFALLLVSRLGDLISTRLATPKLALEANPVVRRFGWRFALLTLLVPMIAYYNTALALMALVPSLMVAASNFSKVWLLRGMGEKAYYELLCNLARGSRARTALGFLAASSAMMALAGATLCVLEGGSTTWGFWFGLGVITYALAIGVHGTAFILRLFRTARSPEASA